ncbi:ribose 5-phosphate isomerase RpiB [Mycoplasmoides fastidiosum]|uniref:Ribose 5-phosphate isomerase RpiB n=1 Tax=Mycoplasmoides fastidiosum TaxID=92758 RepID=A0ABU0LYU2_9BACT|nr:RpiB/LacA/LacB family sugar-phosphate isomerase [Mycoplasmoides fastidiosum]MDQ0513858.1 ribose 5-phosphate isomerase RpiB [Mycoplasmoides fastidiosum]UUD37728.1 RpiB/LacA/LacB family sugar-phosphate isomerase [Mycoplasmoides fastidiosum]
MKIKIYASPDNGHFVKNILTTLKIDEHLSLVLNDNENLNFSIYDQILQEIAEQKYDRIIVIEQYGIAGFMYLTKDLNSIVAFVEDQHSAYMTPLHNNTNIMICPLATIGLENLKVIIQTFLDSKFEAARHWVRLEMLKKLMQPKD